MWWDDNSLLNAYRDEKFGENSLLYTLEYYLLTQDKIISELLLSAINRSEISPGLYHQHPTNFEQMAHDQLTAIVCFFYKTRDPRLETIWEEILKQRFHYDIITPDKPEKLLHPRDVIYYGCLVGNRWAKLLSPVLIAMLVITLLGKKEDTSGKLLWWVRVSCLQGKIKKWLFFKIAPLLMRQSFKEVFAYYFKDADHPINLIAN
jgi:hypothetical protein